MMRLTDAIKLATTKLRTRKVRLVVTIVVAGLMFSVLAAASLVMRGVFDSLAAFNKEGFGERYIVAAQTLSKETDPSAIPAVIDRATAINKDMIAKKTALAKQLGLPYDAKNEPALTNDVDTRNGSKQRSLDSNQPAAKQAIQEYLAAHPGPGQPELKKLAAAYNPISYYESRNPSFGQDTSSLRLVKNGKEAADVAKDGPQQATGLDAFGTTWGLMSHDLLKPFILPNTDTTIGNDGKIPVIAPFNALEQMMGLKSLPTSADPATQLDRIRQVRANAANLSFQVCYRNKTSDDLLNRAVSQQKEIAQNKNNKDYTKPAVIYGVPTQPCTAASIVSDSRSAAEKKNDAKREQFDHAFDYVAPQQQLLTFRVVGVAPNPPSYSGSFVSSIVSSILSSNLGYGGASWFTPVEAAQKQPILNTIFPTVAATPYASNMNTHYAEFSSAKQAEDFVKQAQCEPDYSQAPKFSEGPGPTESFDPFAGCAKQGKYFSMTPFGSNSLALQSVKKGFSKVFSIAALSVAIVAAIIMIGTVGRTIADSRRETAVFRAIGAKKFDIVQIYLIYTTFLSLMIFGFALLAGFAASQFVDHRFSSELTIQTLVAYNAQDLTKVFKFYNFYLPDIARLLGLAIAGGALSAFFPLVRNLRRNPIRDMRDDT